MLHYMRSVNFTTQVIVLIIFVLGILFCFRQLSPPSELAMSSTKLLHLEFEVFGRVQGVFFRKYTQQRAKSLGVRGWIRNTEKNTVQGEIEGTTDILENMKNWLSTEGSPSSRIERAVFKNDREIHEYSYSGFSIKH